MNDSTSSSAAAASAPFGTVFAPEMTQTRYANGQWSAVESVPVAPFPVHPAAHVLHYGSACFEGLKAFRMPDGALRLFRADYHAARMQASAARLCIPVPSQDVIKDMMYTAAHNAAEVCPEPPGALYLRPTLIGTEANIGAAGAPSAEALFYVLPSPVGDYFTGGARPLKILIDDEGMRSTPGFGSAKTGGNYAAALRHVLAAKADHGADQVLFCPHGDVQETGASNFLLLNDKQVLTKPLDDNFLHGATRDSVLTLADHLGYEIIERDFTVDDIKTWIPTGEAMLSGTAAVLAGVGSFVYRGEQLTVGSGEIGPNTQRLREALTAIQFGRADDPFGWLS